jgi:hypothetical protein
MNCFVLERLKIIPNCTLSYLDATRYLGITIHFPKLTNAEWKIVEERLQLRLSS